MKNDSQLLKALIKAINKFVHKRIYKIGTWISHLYLFAVRSHLGPFNGP